MLFRSSGKEVTATLAAVREVTATLAAVREVTATVAAVREVSLIIAGACLKKLSQSDKLKTRCFRSSRRDNHYSYN